MVGRGRSAAEGGQTINPGIGDDAVKRLACGVDPVVAGFAPEPGIREGVQPCALDPQTAKAVGAKSEEMIGERFS